MPEDSPTCRIHEKYRWLKCANGARPGDADGFCILHSQDKGKNPDDFKAALQARWNQEDQESYDFRRVFFFEPFDPKDFFESREFNKPVNFSGATFTEGAHFSGATFTERAFFTVATFTKEADFSGATFTEGAYFTGATFTAEARFPWATIGGRVVFREINPRDEAGRAPPFIGDFSSLEFQDRGVLRFQDTILARVLFEGTDLRRAEFHHVTWNSYQGRQAIYDEVSSGKTRSGPPGFGTGSGPGSPAT